jgi:hypothetical protein
MCDKKEKKAPIRNSGQTVVARLEQAAEPPEDPLAPEQEPRTPPEKK